MTQIKDLLHLLQNWAPAAYQENYDNTGLLVGNEQTELQNVLVSLDVTEEVIEEAIRLNCQAVVSHHPLIFKPLKKLTNANLVERCITQAVKNDIALIAVHTNLDNIQQGVNQKISDKIGLTNTRILKPKSNLLYKLVTYVPIDKTETLLDALFNVGAGKIGNYSECAFRVEGVGSFKGNEQSKPRVGKKLQREQLSENRIEVLVEAHLRYEIISALQKNHPYEEVAYEMYAIENIHPNIGSGMIGELPKKMNSLEFLQMLKAKFHCGALKHTALHQENVKKIALCGGSGSFLLQDALAQKADVFISGDFTYHQYFDADKKIIIADIGHYESEQFTIDLIADKIQQNFSTFAVHLTSINTNPINFL